MSVLFPIRCKRDGEPIVSQANIEDICVALVKDFNPILLTEPGELDIDRFVECYLGYDLDYQYLSSDGRYLGMCVFNDTSRVIVFNPYKNEADYLKVKAKTIIIDNGLLEDKKFEHRYRFTMGHEAGHAILHEDYYVDDNYGEPIVQCRTVDIEGSKIVNKGKKKGSKDVKEWLEWQANRVSSSLLMPKPAVKIILESSKISDKVIRNSFVIKDMVLTFNVSAKSAEIRLRELGYIEKSDLTDYATIANDLIKLVS